MAATGGKVPSLDDLKQQAAINALRHVQSGMVVGLGSGSTAKYFINELGRRLAAGELSNIRGIPTSEPSRELAEQAGVPLVGLDAVEVCDVVVDGADEIDPQLNLIKGLGGALVREKIVAQNSRRRIIIADATKLVEKLGTRTPLPVEVLPFGHERMPAFFRKIGGEPVLRLDEQAQPFVTDNGNFIYDVAFGPIADPEALEITLLRRAGVIQTGLFLHMADEAIVAAHDRIQTFNRV